MPWPSATDIGPPTPAPLPASDLYPPDAYQRFKAAKLRRADPIRHDPRPSYVYRWYTAHSKHISAMGKDGYQRLGDLASPRVEILTPRWDRDWLRMHETAELKHKETEREPAGTP